VAVSAALTGCGGDDNNESTSTTLQATAIDGYLRNALVWLDVNGNNQLDSDEPNGRSGEGGKVTLDVSGVENPSSYRLLVQAIVGETVDETRGAITQTFTLSAPPGVAEVTPLSTLVDQKMQQDPTLDRDAAVAAIAADLGLQPEQVLGDFIADNDVEVQVYAVNLTDQLPESLPDDPTELLNDSKELGQALDEYLEQNPVDENTDPDSINVVVDDQGNVTPIVDQDRDGVADSQDAFPDDATETKDTDGDQVGDNSDAFPNDATETKDSDGDLVGDNSDAFPTDAKEWLDSDGDKVGDNSDAFPTDAKEWLDSDGDKVGDNSDAFPTDVKEWLDSDGDKVGDNSDAFPSDATETKDTDGDQVGDNSDELPLDPLRRQADEVTNEEKVYTYMEDHTKEALSLKLVSTTTVSRYLDGHKETTETGTNYYWDATASAIEQLNGKPLIYNEYTDNKVKQADGNFIRKIWWHKDLNKDGIFAFTGESYAFGVQTETAEDYWRVYDEDDPKAEGVFLYDYPHRFHDGGDYAALIKAGDLSTIDMIHHVTVTQSGGTTSTSFLEYKAPKDESAEPYPAPSDWFDMATKQFNPSYKNNPDDAYKDGDVYAESDTYLTRDDGCTVHTEDQDWQADGSINVTNGLVNCPDGSEEKIYAKPIWANPQDDMFEEYADYNWQSISMTNYWYEYSIKTATVDGQAVTTMAGARYLLNPTTNTRLEDDTHPDGYKFNDYTSVRTVLSPTVEMEHATWHHYHLDDNPATPFDEASFTVSSDDLGQDVKIFFKEINDLWVGHRFAEWGSQNVTDLPGKITALRQQGVTVDQINSSNLPGLSDYDGQLLTSSFRYNADGTPRTWYWVTSLPAVTGDGSLKKIPIQLVNGGLDGAGLPNWIINDAGGNLFMLQPKVAEPWSWYDAYQIWNFGVWKADGQTIDPSGRFDTWAGSFFLDSAQADAEMSKQ
ncbi:MAG: hypothetical protein KBE13_06035, partial [Aeromonadaceae bacterium]|nr:hypothetical protein [Aeromonadaceae bacterium]